MTGHELDNMTKEPALLEMDVQLTFNDYLRFQYYDSLLSLWWVIPFFLLCAGIAFALLVLSAINQDSYLFRDIIPFSSLLILAGIFVFAGPYLSARREWEVRSMLRQTIHYTVRESFLESESARRTGKLPWSKVKEARETGSAFLIYISEGPVLILPKTSFIPLSQMMSMRELLVVILGIPKCKFKLDRISERF